MVLLLFISKNSIAFSTENKDSSSINDVYRYIKCIGILYPDIVLKQAIWETGWFKSKHARFKNNLFGFRYSKKYMEFGSWRSCIDYYKNWQIRKYTDTTEDYYSFLIRIKYATSTKYISSLKSLKVKIPDVECNEK